MTVLTASETKQPFKIMLVEDCDSERCLLSALITAMGLNSVDFSDAESAIDYLSDHDIDLVITDWMMPNMNGIEFCKILKCSINNPYTILLTGNSDNSHIVEGINSGADDYVAKPFNSAVLKARINAGLRIIEMQRQLAQKNKSLNHLLEKEQQYLRLVKQDLALAAQLQQALLPDNGQLNQQWQVTCEFKPAHDLAGDIFQCFNIDEQHIGFYLLDVSGHGTAASMQSFTLAQHLTNNQDAWRALDVCTLINTLNNEFDDPQNSGCFATMVIGIANTVTGAVELVNAGHPAPIVINSQQAYFVDKTQLNVATQLPVGIRKNVQYNSSYFSLAQQEHLLLYSDGIYECRHPKHGFLGQPRLLKIINDARTLTPDSLLHHLTHSCDLWQQKQAQDDVSLMLISTQSATNNAFTCLLN
ncbi:SpoIIE family protein phosphatase [Shewanella sp. GutDb-MelDb]|uniref:SpoIIE family protein phosphatase n=1 Tax=Shewanella sp. GutDb-MelDb TaxID=2058316 RepID=UPI000C7DB53C|nr:SpoIIE family protein phosphatase [Shewanella sp. GutDb-MelDb]PKG56609.1 serine/threonine protein phosphatase [Shewanella sp. GutDb-MelDb]